MKALSIASLGLTASLFSFSALLTGCTFQSSAPLGDTTLVPGTAISGVVHGGQQTIVNAKVYLLAVNPSGYGGPGITASSANASLSMLNPAGTGNLVDSIGSYVLTDSVTGAFSLSGNYSCNIGYLQGTNTPTSPYGSHQTAGTEQVYLYVLGGEASVDNPTGNNTASGLLVALGPCNNPTSKVAINEITTVATAYAFAGFASDATHIGSSGSALALTNLANAFASVANLANTSTGVVTASSTNIIVPVANIYTLADILAACVNTSGSTATGANCTTLFAHTKSAGDSGTAPAETATAAINLAHNPWPSDTGMTALYGLIPSIGAPFTGATPSQPLDFTLFLQFNNSALNQPWALAIDAQGSVWTGNYAFNSNATGTVSKFSNAGALLFTTNPGSVFGPTNIAIDNSGNAWVANSSSAPGGVSEFSNTGTPVTGPGPYFGGGGNRPYGVAIDAIGDAWLTNPGDGKISEFNSSGTPVSTSLGYLSADSDQPAGIAIDVAGYVWVTNRLNETSISKFNSNGVPVSGTSGYTGGGLTGAGSIAIAIDAAGNAWTANTQASTLSEISSTGNAISPSTGSNGSSGGYTAPGTGLNGPYSIAIDGAGVVWVCNNGSNTISAFTSAGVPISPTNNGFANGYTGGYGISYNTGTTLNQPVGIAIDGAGDVWISSYGNNALSEMIGAAAPVATPIAANLVSPYGTAAVNLP